MNVLVIAPLSDLALLRLERIDRRVRATRAWELFGPELVADWPPHTVDWYVPPEVREVVDSPEMRRERDRLLFVADVVCITFPYPTRIVGRAPRLRFVHQLPAGVSNLMRGDLWRTRVPVSSGRGAGNTLPIAEWAIAAALALCKEFPRAQSQRASGHLDRGVFEARQVAGKTLGVVGLGGIGREVARLGAALGMRVIGTRRSAAPVPYVERLVSPGDLPELLRDSDIVVLCTQLTEATHHVIDRLALQSMRRGAFLINVARGELIDENALMEALRRRHLGGFAADVYDGEFEHQPRPDLLELDNVLLTPHTSGQTEHPSRGAVDLLCDNVRRCLADEPLLNLVDWQRGY